MSARDKISKIQREISWNFTVRLRESQRERRKSACDYMKVSENVGQNVVSFALSEDRQMHPCFKQKSKSNGKKDKGFLSCLSLIVCYVVVSLFLQINVKN